MISYPIINSVTCVPELQVKFKTYSKVDQQTYRGRILGCVNFTAARGFGDIISMHNDMKASVAKQEVVVDTFLLIETTDGAIRPFAVSWINADTFEQTDASKDVNLVLHNVTQSQLAIILTLIRDRGFDVTEA